MPAHRDVILLLTRPLEAAQRFAADLLESGRGAARTVFSPLIDIEFAPEPPELADGEGVLFTSANGVAALRRPGVARGLPCWCVGPSTAKQAASAGWDVRGWAPDADGLVRLLTDAAPEMSLVHVAGRQRRGNIAERLSAAGLSTREAEVYWQTPRPFTSEAVAVLRGAVPVVAPVFSPQTARHFARGADVSAPLWLAAISPAAAKPLENLPVEALAIAKTPDAAGMIGETRRLITRAARVEGGSGED